MAKKVFPDASAALDGLLSDGMTLILTVVKVLLMRSLNG